MKDLVHDLLTLFFLLEGFFVLVIPGAVMGLVRSGFLLLLGLGGDGGLGGFGGLGGSGGLVAPVRAIPGLILGLPSCLPPSRIFFARFMAAFL
jgi:hypothetical protein